MRAALLCFALLAALGSPVPAHERDALKRALAEADIPFRESIGGLDTGTDGAWMWVETHTAGNDEDDGFFVQSPDLLPSDAPVLGIPLEPDRDSLGPGALSALTLLKRRRADEGALPLSVVFYDTLQNRGLIEFSEALEDPEDTRLLLLKLSAPPEPAESPGAGMYIIYHGSHLTVAPLSMVENLTQLLEQQQIPYLFSNRFNELYKLGISRGPPELEVTGQYAILALLLSGPESGSGGASESLLAALDTFFNQVRVEPGNADLHYSMYRMRGTTFFVSEQTTVLVIILINGVFYAALLLSSLTRRVKMLFLLKTGLSHIWVSALYYAGLFLSMLLAHALFMVVIRIFHPAPPGPDLQSFFGGPARWLFIEISLVTLTGIAFFFLTPVNLLSLIPLVRRGGFYGFTALLSAALSLLFGIYLDLTTAHFFAWMLIFVSLSMMWDHPAPPLLFTLLTLLRPGLVLWAIIETGDSGDLLMGNILLSSLAAAVILFPPALSFMRAMVLTIRQWNRRQRILGPVRIAFTGLCLVLMLLWGILFRTV
jgi:hypothetical protein